MKRIGKIIFLLIAISSICACRKKTNKDAAIKLVESRYQDTKQALNFENASLDSLYNISPEAYADSIKKGNDLDAELAALEGQIEHFPQKESDSVGLISAALTKRRYHLLEIDKIKPFFKGWMLTNVAVEGEKSSILHFEFDTGVTKIVD